MRHLVQHDGLAAGLIRDWTGQMLSPPYAGLIVIDKPGEPPLGAVIVNNYSGQACDVSVVGRHCWTRSILADLYDYVFRRLGCHRVAVRIRAADGLAASLLERLGFRWEGLERDFYIGENAARWGLLASDATDLLKGTRHERSEGAGSLRHGGGAIESQQGDGKLSDRPERHESGHALRKPELHRAGQMVIGRATLHGDADPDA